ncbi:MAG: hypothetical protein KCHDKBKB_01296 [Elusimicrobia bacterium]|nr:hypothetical protein [Elusimicrobiota bacterium]
MTTPAPITSLVRCPTRQREAMKIRSMINFFAVWVLIWGAIIWVVFGVQSAKVKDFVSDARPAIGKIMRIDSEVRQETSGSTRYQSSTSRSTPMVKDVMYWRMVIDYEADGQMKTFRSPLTNKMPEGTMGDPVNLLVSTRLDKVMLKQTVEERLDHSFFIIGWVFMCLIPIAGIVVAVPVLMIFSKFITPLLARSGSRLFSKGTHVPKQDI